MIQNNTSHISEQTTEQISDRKKQLRKQIKCILEENKSHFENWSSTICKKIINSSKYKNADTIFAYMALPDEVNLQELIDDAKLKNKSVYIPKVIPNTQNMIFYKLTDNLTTTTGSFGITEPASQNSENSINADCKDFFKNNEILFLVPGRAFTTNGDRLGRGKGFYDFFLSTFLNSESFKDDKSENKKNRVHITGICFPPQIVKNLPVNEHDIKMTEVIY